MTKTEQAGVGMIYWRVKLRIYYKGGNKPKFTEHRVLVATEDSLDHVASADSAMARAKEFAGTLGEVSHLRLGVEVLEAGTVTLPMRLK